MTQSDRFTWGCSGIPSVEARGSSISISSNDSSKHQFDNARVYRNLWIDINPGLRIERNCGYHTAMRLVSPIENLLQRLMGSGLQVLSGESV